MNNKIEKIWEEHGYLGFQKLWDIVKKDHPEIDYKTAKEGYDSIVSVQLYKKQQPQKKYEKKIKTFAKCVTWQVDLLDFQNFSRMNKGYKYIFIGMDIFAKYGFAYPLKSKQPIETVAAIKDMIKKLDCVPMIIQHDEGTEYKGQFGKFLEDEKIVQIWVKSGDHNKIGLINRFSQTLKNTIYKYMHNKDTSNWSQYLDEIINIYNNTPKSTMCDLTPKEMWDSHDKTVLCYKNLEMNAIDRNISVGDSVRLLLKKKSFNKGYERKWSLDTFTVESIDGIYYNLSNKERVRGDRLQVVPKESVKEETKEFEKEVKHGKFVKRLKKENLFPVDEKTGEYIIPRYLRPN